MRAMRCMVSGILAAALVAMVASAQPGGGFGGGDLTMSVLTNTALQEELKLTDKQKEDLKAVAEKQTKAFADARDKFKDLKGDFTKIREFVAEIQADLKKEVDKILTAEQKKRLKQISVQQLGMNAFNDPEAKGRFPLSEAQKDLMKEVQEALKLTDQQKSSLKGITTDYAKERTELFKGAKSKEAFETATAKSEKLQKEAMVSIEKLLDDNQKKTWKELQGEPFDLTKLQFQFPTPKGKDKDKE